MDINISSVIKLGGCEMKLNIFKYGVCFFLLFTLGFSLRFSSAKVSNGIIVNTVNLSENVGNIIFNIRYPEIKFSNEHVQNKINILIKENIYEFKKYIEDVYNEALSVYPQETVNFLPYSNYEGSAIFDYEIVENILSIKITFSQFTGGAHPIVSVKEYNFDLGTGDILNLEDIFNGNGKNNYKNLISDIILDKMNQNPESYFVDEFKGVDKNTGYYLTRDDIVIFFQLYEVAPYSSGIVEFKIPYSKLYDYLIFNNSK